MNYNWNWKIFWDLAPDGSGSYLQVLLGGLVWTLATALAAGACVNLMRSIPLVLVIFWFFFLVPYIGAWIIGAKEPIKVGAFWSSVITFTMFEAADFLGSAVKVANRDGRLFEMYLFVAFVYFLMRVTASHYVRRLQARICVVR